MGVGHSRVGGSTPMTTQSIKEIIPVKEQRLVLPGRQSWQQFKAIQSLMAEVPDVQIY